MILRYLLAAFGVVEILRPRGLVDFAMDLATEGDGSVTVAPWVYTAARVEGVLLLLWALRSRTQG